MTSAAVERIVVQAAPQEKKAIDQLELLTSASLVKRLSRPAGS